MTPFPKPPKRKKAPRKPLKRSTPIRGRKKPARRKGTPARKRLPRIKSLRERADSLMSVLVRTRDGKCVITGAMERLQAAHFYGKKARPAVRYDFMNVHTLWSGKHMETDRHDPGIYFDWMRAHYTPAQLDALEARSRIIRTGETDRDYYNRIISWLEAITPEEVLAATWPKG